MSVEFNAVSSNYNAGISGKSGARSAKKCEVPQLDGGSEAGETKLAEAIRLYKNYTLTGVKELTNEEKEEIKGKIDEYMEKTGFLDKYSRNKTTKDDYEALNGFVQALYRQFGSKSDYYEFATELVEGMTKAAENPNDPPNPPFRVIIPPEHKLEMENMKKKPMLAGFESPSPHQFLTAGGGSEKV